MSIPLGKDPVTGERLRRRFAVQGTKKDAADALARAIVERDHGGVDPARITTGEWLTKWLGENVQNGQWGPEVTNNYDGILRNHLIPAVGHVLLQDLGADHIRALRNDLLQKRAASTVHGILTLLGQALKAAVTQELLVRNPAEAVPKPRVRREDNKRTALDRDEVKELLRVTEGTAYEMPTRFALHTGVREGELLGAKWDAIDMKTHMFHVERTLHYVDGEFTFLDPKTAGSRRAIQLSETMVERLRDHHAAQQAAQAQLGAAWEDHDLVFPTEHGKHWRRQVFYRGFRKLVAESRIDNPAKVVFHVLRHTAASQWIAAGVDVLTVSRRLGHSTAAFTMDVYGHLLPGQQQAAADASDDLLE